MKWIYAVTLILFCSCTNSLLSELDSFYDVYITAAEIRPMELDDTDHALGDLTLKKSVGSKNISWSTGDHPGISETGTLLEPMYPAAAITAEITAVVTFKNGSTKSFTFTVIVPPMPIDNQIAVNEAADALLIYYTAGDNAGSITNDITLKTNGLHATSVSWNTSGNSAIGPDGSVTRPSYSSGDSNGSIIATITKGGASATKSFSLTVIKLSPTSTEKAQADADALTISYASGDSASSVTENIGLPSSAGSYGSSISWSTSGHTAINGSGVLSISSSDWGGSNWWSSSSTSKSGTVTATVTNGSASVTKNFSLTVIAEAPSIGPFNALYTQFGRRYLSWPKISGGTAVNNYDVEYRAFSGGSWGSYQDTPSAAASTSGDPVKFGWHPVHLADGHYQFRVRVTRDGRDGPWAYTGEFNPFY